MSYSLPRWLWAIAAVYSVPYRVWGWLKEDVYG